MYAGIADVAALTKDSAYMKVIDRIFENIVGIYIIRNVALMNVLPFNDV